MNKNKFEYSLIYLHIKYALDIPTTNGTNVKPALYKETTTPYALPNWSWCTTYIIPVQIVAKARAKAIPKNINPTKG